MEQERMDLNMNKWYLPIGAALICVLASLYFYAELPDQMAVHFDTSEQPDRYFSKLYGAFFTPALILFIQLLMTWKITSESDTNKRQRLQSTQASSTSIIVAALTALHFFTLAYNLGYPVTPSLFAALTVGILFIALGNLLPRMPQNRMRFIQLPEEAYAVYARWQGRIMVAAGLLLLLSSVLTSTVRVPYVLTVLGLFLVYTIGSVIYYSTRREHYP
jgi:uncharacterized membrane protein